MPVQRGKDSKGSYYRWGGSGAKYRYTPGSKASRRRAKEDAKLQGRAIKTMQNVYLKRRNNDANKLSG
jgi:hypothetical protein